MRYGFCLFFSGSDDDLAAVELLAGLGYQYLEPPVGCLKIEGEPEEYYAVRRAFHRAALRPEAFNCFLPGDLKVVGDHVDWRRVEKYVALALERVEEVGGTTVVFGSGGARSVPEGYPVEEARTQLVYFGNMLADYAGNLTLAVEPLEPAGCNILNTVPETAQYVREVGRPEVRLLVDSYHMEKQAEGWEPIGANADLVAHVHVSGCCRLPPGADEADLAGFFAALKQAGYDGRVSVECLVSDLPQEAAAALEVMKDLVARKR